MAQPAIPDLFKGTAWYYARFRPPYPDELFDHVKKRFGLDGTGTLLDLGCGTGNLAIPLATEFEEVIGIDLEPEMLAEARQQALRAGVGNITWIESRAEDVNSDVGPFRLVTMGGSFHWMDRDATLGTLAERVVPGGGIAVVWVGGQQSGWSEVVQKVIRRWLGEERRAGSGTYSHPEERHETVIARSAFKHMETFESSYRRRLDVDAILGQLYSTSYCSIPVLGDNREPLETDLRQRLAEFEPSGRFDEEVRTEAILAWKENGN